MMELSKERRRKLAVAAKDRSFWLAPDFDAPLDDFKEYME